MHHRLAIAVSITAAIGIIVTGCGSSKDKDKSSKAAPKKASSKAENMASTVMTQLTALSRGMEECAASNADGRYAGCTIDAIAAGNTTIEGVRKNVFDAGYGSILLNGEKAGTRGTVGYSIAIVSEDSKLQYNIERKGGELLKTCSPAGEAGCSKSGEWK